MSRVPPPHIIPINSDYVSKLLHETIHNLNQTGDLRVSLKHKEALISDVMVDFPEFNFQIVLSIFQHKLNDYKYPFKLNDICDVLNLFFFNYFHDLIVHRDNVLLIKCLTNNCSILERLTDLKKRNLLYSSCVQANFEISNELLSLCPALAFASDDEGYLPLHAAAQQGSIDQFVRLYTMNPIGILHSAHNGRIPLHFACQQGNLSIAQYILNKQPQCAHCVASRDGRLPIHLAAFSGNVQLVKLLLQYYPECYKKTTLEGYMPMSIAAEYGHLELVHLLYELYPASLHHFDNSNRTPLFLAAYARQMHILRFFCSGQVAEECIMTVNSTTQRNILHELTLLQADFDIIQLVLQGVYRRELCEHVDINGFLPLHMASQSGDYKLFSAILSVFPQAAGAVSVTNRTPLHFAAQTGCVPIVKKLLSMNPYTAEIQSQDEYEVYPIHLAALHGHVEVVRLLANPKLPIGERVSVYRNSRMQNALHSLCDGLQHGNLGDLCARIATASATSASSSSSSSTIITSSVAATATATAAATSSADAVISTSSLLLNKSSSHKSVLFQQMESLLKLFNDILSLSSSSSAASSSSSSSATGIPPCTTTHSHSHSHSHTNSDSDHSGSHMNETNPRASTILASSQLFQAYTLDEQILTPFELLLPPNQRVDVIAILQTMNINATPHTSNTTATATAFGSLTSQQQSAISSDIIQDLPIHILSKLKDNVMVLANTATVPSIYSQSSFISAFKNIVNNGNEIELFKTKVYEICRLLLTKEKYLCTNIQKLNKYSDSYISYLTKNMAYLDIHKWLNWNFRKSAFLIAKYGRNNADTSATAAASSPASLRIVKEFYFYQFDLFRHVVMYL